MQPGGGLGFWVLEPTSGMLRSFAGAACALKLIRICQAILVEWTVDVPHVPLDM